jgi:hypothetical protein
MGKDLCEQFGAAREIFAQADDALGFSLSKVCFSGPEAELKLTEILSPLFWRLRLPRCVCWKAKRGCARIMPLATAWANIAH